MNGIKCVASKCIKFDAHCRPHRLPTRGDCLSVACPRRPGGEVLGCPASGEVVVAFMIGPGGWCLLGFDPGFGTGQLGEL